MYFLGTTIPTGYLIQNGASVLRSDYPELFNVIGTKFGATDSLHFNLPNGHHRFSEGTTTLSEVATYAAAGSPNNAGVFTSFDMESFEEPTEAFTADWNVEVQLQRNDESGAKFRESRLVFKASNSNSIYSDSVLTVQPAAMRALVLVRAY